MAAGHKLIRGSRRQTVDAILVPRGQLREGGVRPNSSLGRLLSNQVDMLIEKAAWPGQIFHRHIGAQPWEPLKLIRIE